MEKPPGRICETHTILLLSERTKEQVPPQGSSNNSMGINASKNKSNLCDSDFTGMMENTRFFQKAMKEMASEREREKQSKAYERDMIVFEFKEAEWKQERRMLREEVKSLRKMVEEKEDRIKEMGEKSEKKGWELLMKSGFLVKQMREERARRDGAVEKWKQLYLAIKMELDDLIQRTHHAEVQYNWKAEEEEMIQELQRELHAKEETIRDLKARMSSMEYEEYKKEREIDILRQSLRIMSSKKSA